MHRCLGAARHDWSSEVTETPIFCSRSHVTPTCRKQEGQVRSASAGDIEAEFLNGDRLDRELYLAQPKTTATTRNSERGGVALDMTC